MSENRPRIQSYVADKWFVSTVWRPFDTYEGTSWGYETMVWRWDNLTKESGAFVHQGAGLASHFDICQKLLKGGEEALEDERE